MKWIKASERLPEKEGYYITDSEWVGGGPILTNDWSDTYFSKGKWNHSDKWLVIAWLDETPEDQGREKAIGFAEWLGGNYDCFLTTNHGVVWTKSGHFTTSELYDIYEKTNQ